MTRNQSLSRALLYAQKRFHVFIKEFYASLKSCRANLTSFMHHRTLIISLLRHTSCVPRALIYSKWNLSLTNLLIPSSLLFICIFSNDDQPSLLYYSPITTFVQQKFPIKGDIFELNFLRVSNNTINSRSSRFSPIPLSLQLLLKTLALKLIDILSG